MNLSLLDPFTVAKEYPETLSQELNHGRSVCIEFNNKGDYLASGTVDGSIVIYDLDTTNGVVTILKDHSRSIQSLSWSKCGRYILSASRDWKCNLWDLSTNEIIRSVRFDGQIWVSELHPFDKFKFTAALFEDKPVLVDLTDATNTKISYLETTPLQQQEEIDEPASKKKKEKHLTLVSTFNPNGTLVFTGTNKGWLNVIDVATLTTVYSMKISNSNIKHIKISTNGRKMVVNSSDRIIRQIDLPDLLNEEPKDWDFEIQHKYQDVVNRLQWNSVSFNHNAEYLIASTFASAQDIYMWETNFGSLIKAFEGQKEELSDVAWDFKRCVIAATGSDSGTIYLWSTNYPQKWSALAPDFVEIDENIEYEEKEDEFDIVPEEELNQRQLDAEDEYIDIISKENTDGRGFAVEDSFIIPIDYDQELDLHLDSRDDD